MGAVKPTPPVWNCSIKDFMQGIVADMRPNVRILSSQAEETAIDSEGLPSTAEECLRCVRKVDRNTQEKMMQL